MQLVLDVDARPVIRGTRPNVKSAKAARKLPRWVVVAAETSTERTDGQGANSRWMAISSGGPGIAPEKA